MTRSTVNSGGRQAARRSHPVDGVRDRSARPCLGRAHAAHRACAALGAAPCEARQAWQATSGKREGRRARARAAQRKGGRAPAPARPRRGRSRPDCPDTIPATDADARRNTTRGGARRQGSSALARPRVPACRARRHGLARTLAGAAFLATVRLGAMLDMGWWRGWTGGGRGGDEEARERVPSWRATAATATSRRARAVAAGRAAPAFSAHPRARRAAGRQGRPRAVAHRARSPREADPERFPALRHGPHRPPRLHPGRHRAGAGGSEPEVME